jgi:hypothetical protein
VVFYNVLTIRKPQNSGIKEKKGDASSREPWVKPDDPDLGAEDSGHPRIRSQKGLMGIK